MPPNWALKLGYTNLLHKVVNEQAVELLDKVLNNELCPEIDIKDSEGINCYYKHTNNHVNNLIDD